VSRDERALEPADLIEDVPSALVAGRLEVLGRLPRASNLTLLVRAIDDGDELLAVYKPMAGEAPLWDFPTGTLHRREVAAHRTARALGWPAVPATVLRDGPLGVGCVQRFVDHDPEATYFTLGPEHAESLRRIALFDLVVNNADRKAGHCLLDDAGRIWCVDHGVCFAVHPTLRTVIWDFVGEPIPPSLAADLARVEQDLIARGALHRALAELLSPEEVRAVGRRVRALLEIGRFPEPGPGRPFPWPPI
jgi:uncharacterized repeat protein (TIGR03843 family)